MKRTFYYSFFMFILSFIFIINVNAECSYQERKTLLNDAKSVNISVSANSEEVEEKGSSPLSDEEETYITTKYSFTFNVVNLTDNLFIKYYNDYDDVENYIMLSDFSNGVYSFKDDNEDSFKTYYFEFRSNNDNCPGQLMYTKKVVKPKYNYLSSFNECSNEKMQNNKYCQKFITKDLEITEEEFLKVASEIIYENNNDVEDNGDNVVINIIQSYWYILVIILILIISVVIFIVLKKKKEKLV